MAHRLPKRSALLAKIEAVYGTDPVPVGATDAMYVYDLAITPMELVAAGRMPVRPFFGADTPAIGGTPVKVTFNVPIAGSGAAGTAAPYGSLLRACARSQTINAAVDVIYSLVSSTFDSLTLYVNRDGVLHKITGARGSVSVEFAHNAIPLYKFSFTGIYNAPSDVALPALTFGATWVKPLVQNKVNTTFSLHGFTAVLSKFDYDTGVEMGWKDYVNNTEEVRITGRAAPIKGNVSVQADTIAAKDWFSIAKAGTTGALALVHGTTAGNKWKLDAATVLVSNPAEEDEDGILMYKLGLEFFPSGAGNDEIVERIL
jgi:hypothetical protein